MMAATIQRLKPNESQSFPDPLVSRDTVAASPHAPYLTVSFFTLGKKKCIQRSLISYFTPQCTPPNSHPQVCRGVPSQTFSFGSAGTCWTRTQPSGEYKKIDVFSEPVLQLMYHMASHGMSSFSQNINSISFSIFTSLYMFKIMILPS